MVWYDDAGISKEQKGAKMNRPIIKRWKIHWRGLDGYALRDGSIAYYPDEDPERNAHTLAHEAAHQVTGEGGHSLEFWAVFDLLCEYLGISHPDWAAPWRSDEEYPDARAWAEQEKSRIEIWVQAILKELGNGERK
jgi:hypothetical protein